MALRGSSVCVIFFTLTHFFHPLVFSVSVLKRKALLMVAGLVSVLWRFKENFYFYCWFLKEEDLGDVEGANVCIRVVLLWLS